MLRSSARSSRCAARRSTPASCGSAARILSCSRWHTNKSPTSVVATRTGLLFEQPSLGTVVATQQQNGRASSVATALPMVHAFHMHQPAQSSPDASEHEAPARRLLARAVAFVLYFRAGGSFVLLFPCAGGADPSLVCDPCQAREQANNPRQEFLGSLRDDPKASQSHASTARYASEPQLAGQLRRAVLA